MIGHEAVSAHLAIELEGELSQPVRVARVVSIGEEANAAIVAVLNDVHGHTAGHYACESKGPGSISW